jgi:hypothetical protein
LVDTKGLVLHAVVHAADIQDRDGGVLVMASLFGMYPFLLKLYADGGYQGPQFQDALLRVVRQVDVDRQAFGCGERLYRSTEALACRTHHRLAQSMPEAGQRLGMLKPLGVSIPALVLSPNDAQKALSNHQMISDRL